MKTKLFTLLLTVAASVGTMLAEKVQIGVLYYNLDDENKTAEVTWSDGDKYSGSVAIPESITYNAKTYNVTNIGNFAFTDCSGLTSIEIPNNVSSIGVYVFFGCTGLTSITIPNNITSIGEGIFYGCSGLTSVVWNAINCNDFSYYESPFYRFYDNTYEYDIRAQITSFVFGKEVEYIPAYLCNGMSQLNSISIPNSVTSIGGGAFSGCTSLPVIDNIRYADTYLVEVVDKTLSTYTIKEGTKWIGSSVFKNCTSLTSIEIPNSVTNIGSSAFFNCTNLTSAIIGNSVKSIGAYAFCQCFNLASMEIPNSVLDIGVEAFGYCSSMTSLIIGKCITHIEGYTFKDCRSLESVKCYAIVPPKMGTLEDGYIVDAFNGDVDCSKIPLYVPSQSVEAYKEADQWKKFYPILAITQDIDAVNDHHNSSSKLLRNGNVYILTDDSHTYTLTGQEVR